MVDENIGDPSTPETVPKGRFEEVYKKSKEQEQELQALRSQSGIKTPEEQKEEKARVFLKGLVKEQLEEEAKAKKAAATKEQEEFNKEVKEVLSINKSVDREEFLKFMEEKSNEYTITTVKGAMKLYKDLNQIKDETVEQTKENLAAKPKMPKSKGTAEVKTDYAKEDEGKTYEQVVQEIHKEAEELESRK